jgi:hypothetical protein
MFRRVRGVMCGKLYAVNGGEPRDPAVTMTTGLQRPANR